MFKLNFGNFKFQRNLNHLKCFDKVGKDNENLIAIIWKLVATNCKLNKQI